MTIARILFIGSSNFSKNNIDRSIDMRVHKFHESVIINDQTFIAIQYSATNGTQKRENENTMFGVVNATQRST